MESINYGLDEGQESAILWAVQNLDCHIKSLEFNIRIDEGRLEQGLARTDGNLRSRIQQRLKVSRQRLEVLTSYRESLKPMIGGYPYGTK